MPHLLSLIRHRPLYLALLIVNHLIAQPPICRSVSELQKKRVQDPDQTLHELRALDPTFRYELKYATAGNFVGRMMYPARTKTTYLRRPPAMALAKLQGEFREMGLGIKIWDAYRPYSVTVAFWELIGDERYVANPSKGSGHNRGVAVDLTLIELESGKELNMGTGFDHFSDSAHHSFSRLPMEVLNNRNLLRSKMEKYGFKAYEEEWWHYSWPDPGKYDLLDIPFQKLRRRH